MEAAPGSFCRFRNSQPIFVPGYNKLTITWAQLLQTTSECLVAGIDLRPLAFGSCRNGLVDILIKYDLGPCIFLLGIADSPVGDPASPGQEVCSFIEFAVFLADDEICFLEQILSLNATRHNRENVRKDLTLMQRNQLPQLFTSFGLTIWGGTQIPLNV